MAKLVSRCTLIVQPCINVGLVVVNMCIAVTSTKKEIYVLVAPITSKCIYCFLNVIQMCYAAIIAATISRFVRILVPPHFGRRCDYLIFRTVNF